MLVMKKSGKPFKCGKIVASVTGYTTNPHCPQRRKAAIMQDGSVVNLDRLTYKVK